jgi:DNA invertase Pin-like site-specific DNA recombinase
MVLPDFPRKNPMPQCFSYTRMSSPEQLKGDSLRRQLEQSRDYAERHGLNLVELNDLGISAYRGKNVGPDAALGQFLDAVRKKKVEPGAVLLIENLDRLSRQQVFRAFGLFSEIVTAGVKVVTLTDGRTYDSEIGLSEMLVSIVTMERAHQESDIKSRRGKASWNNKRARMKARTEILTGRTKGWLKPRPDRRGFDVDKKQAKTVEQVFSMAADLGMGVDAIARKLNQDRVPTFSKRGTWYKTVVLRLLRDRAVLGEMVPHVMIEGKRTPTEVEADYFPRLVSDDTFYRAQAALSRRRIAGGGRRGERVSNLFTHLCKCGRCGATMHMLNRSDHSGRWLVCNETRRGLSDCRPSSWKYESFERSFLTFVREVDLTAMTGTTGQHELDQVEVELRATQGKLEAARVQRDRAFQLIVEGESDYLKGKLRELDQAVSDLERRESELSNKHLQLTAEARSLSRSKAELADLIDRIQGEGDSVYALRSTLAARLRDMIDVVGMFPGRKKDGGHFVVHFKDGSRRVVYPSAEDPTKFLGFGHTQEGIVTDGGVRFLLARYGITDPTLAQHDEMTSDLVAAGRNRAELGDAALLPLHEKWEKRRVGPDQAVEVMIELKKKYRELGIE